MDPFFDPQETRFVAAALFGGVAATLALLWAGMLLLKRRAGWPMFLGGFVGLWVWQIAAVGLFWDGSTLAGLTLTGIIGTLLLAGCLTFCINDHAWLVAVAFALLGAGALFVASSAAVLWLTGGLALLLLVLVGFVFLSGNWWSPVGYFVAGLMLCSLGGACALATSAGAGVLWRNITNVRAGEPTWLVLLLLIPLTIWWSFRSLAGLGTARRVVALGLRCSLLLFLTLALAEVYLLHSNDTMTVLFLWDRSLSIPEEIDPDDPNADKTDLIKARHLAFINNAVALRGAKHQRDIAGLIVFGRYPRVELPPDPDTSVPHFRLRKIKSTIDKNYTDIGAALKLAIACFPGGTGKRIVLISDGNENLGKAEEQARIAKQNGIEIDTILVSSNDRNQHEVLVERIEAPTFTEAGKRMPIRIVVRSYVPRPVVGWLSITKTSTKMKFDASGQLKVSFQSDPIERRLVRVGFGLNPFSLDQPGLPDEESCTYEASFEPVGVERVPIDLDDPNLAKLDKEAVKLDRRENNYASATILARGEKRVLLIEQASGDHALLLKTLRSNASLKVGAITPDQLPQDFQKLNLYLSWFDCIILANVPRDLFSPEQDAALRTCAHEQGCGLIMIGGRYGFGGGGWQNTEVEKALPVTCDLKSLKVEGRSGLVLIMHASEIAEGNMWQKKIAKLAIEKLAPIDMMGMLYFNWTEHKWHIPFQTVGEGKQKMLALVDSMNPGDMPDAAPSLKKAYDTLTDPAHALGTKHIIFISDGDHWQPPGELLKSIGAAGITLTTVCVTSHGQGEYKRMKDTVDLTIVDKNAPRGRSYPPQNADGTFTPLNPSQLPQIYIKETRLINQSFIFNKTFNPELFPQPGPTAGLPKALPSLGGFVRTTQRPGPFVQIPIMSPPIGDNPWPILAHWQYGLGKGVAFTSDAQSVPPKIASWDVEWAKWDKYAKFWDQLVGWSLRDLDQGKNLEMTTEYRNGKVLIVIQARDDAGKPLSDLDIVVGVTSPTAKVSDANRSGIRLEQTNAGRYEAEAQAETVGSYILTAKAFRTRQVKDGDKTKSVREPYRMVSAAVTVPYSPEFAEMESNPGLLQRLSAITGGKVFEDDGQVLAEVAKSGEVFRASPVRTKALQSVWHWLLVLTGLGLFFDVAVRRIAIDPSVAASALQARWQRLRGMRPVQAAAPQFLNRLKSRKEQVGESIEKDKAGRRFDGDGGPAEAPPMLGAEPAAKLKPPTRPVGPAPQVGPEGGGEGEGQAADYASRLLRAKRKAMEDRDKEK